MEPGQYHRLIYQNLLSYYFSMLLSNIFKIRNMKTERCDGRRCFSDHPPARAVVEVRTKLKEAKVEIKLLPAVVQVNPCI